MKYRMKARIQMFERVVKMLQENDKPEEFRRLILYFVSYLYFSNKRAKNRYYTVLRDIIPFEEYHFKRQLTADMNNLD